MTLQQCLMMIPGDLEIICQFTRRPLYLSINNLLAEVLGENKPVPRHRIIAEKKKGKTGFYFSVLDETMNRHEPAATGSSLCCASQCKADGALHLARERNMAILSKYVFKLVNSLQASKQLEGRAEDGSGAYLLIHDNSRRTKGKRGPIAVVRWVSRSRLLFVHYNHQYKTESMSYCFLDMK